MSEPYVINGAFRNFINLYSTETNANPAEAHEFSTLLLQIPWTRGRLPPTLAEALISLILNSEKKNDLLDCKNCGPISLINWNYKILVFSQLFWQ